MWGGAAAVESSGDRPDATTSTQMTPDRQAELEKELYQHPSLELPRTGKARYGYGQVISANDARPPNDPYPTIYHVTPVRSGKKLQLLWSQPGPYN